jgi:uncharacterized membrane protein
MEINEEVCQLFTNFKKISFKWEVLHNIVMAFGVPIALVSLMKMGLNETCSRVKKVKVNQSRYRHGGAQRVSGS